MYWRRRDADRLRDADAVAYDDGHRNANEATDGVVDGDGIEDTDANVDRDARRDAAGNEIRRPGRDADGDGDRHARPDDQRNTKGRCDRRGRAELSITVRARGVRNQRGGHRPLGVRFRRPQRPALLDSPGATWSRTPGGDDTTYDAGETSRYTFEVTGTYDYYCGPHRQFGMTGSFTVE